MKSLDHTIEQAKLAFEKSLKEQFPDIRKYIGRWGKTVYCSTLVNHLVDEFEQRHNCGCCVDSPLEVWPYITINEQKIYSDPPYFNVGEAFMYGDKPNKNWESLLTTHCISSVVIGKIKLFFEERKQYAKQQITEEIRDLEKYLQTIDQIFL